MWKLIGCVMLVCATASADSTRYVDATVKYKQTVSDAGTDLDTTQNTCTKTGKSKMELSETVLVTAGKVPIRDNPDHLEFSLPRSKVNSSGGAHYEVTVDGSEKGCNSTQTTVGSAHADGDAKEIHVSLSLDKKTSAGALTIQATYPGATGAGKMTVIDNSGTQTSDGGPFIAAQAGLMETTLGNVSLMTKASLAEIDKTGAAAHEAMKAKGQYNPILVQTTGKSIDVTFTESETLDVAKLSPPDENHQRKLIRTITTEVSIHLTPSK